jgi:tetratricopeptide (TPR) repeat protein
MMRLRRHAAVFLLLGCLTCDALPADDEYEQAVQLQQKGQDDAAMTHLDAFLSEHPRDSRARFLKAVILADHDRTQEAIAVLTALSADFPELPEPHNNLAVLYASQGKYDAARRELDLAVRAYPGYAIAYQNLGDIYAALAAQAYEHALQADAKSEVARKKLEQIRALLPQGAVAAAPALGPTGPAAATGPGPQPARPPSQAASAAAPAVSEKPQTPAAPAVFDATEARRAVLTSVEDWAKAWSSKDVEKFLSFYAEDFHPPKGELRGKWEAQRSLWLTKPRLIRLDVIDPKVTFTDANHATVTFKQNYRADAYRSSGIKTLEMVRQGKRWLIQRETITFQ